MRARGEGFNGKVIPACVSAWKFRCRLNSRLPACQIHNEHTAPRRSPLDTLPALLYPSEPMTAFRIRSASFPQPSARMTRTGDRKSQTGGRTPQTGGRTPQTAASLPKAGGNLRKTAGRPRKAGGSVPKTGASFRKTGGRIRILAAENEKLAPVFHPLTSRKPRKTAFFGLKARFPRILTSKP